MTHNMIGVMQGRLLRKYQDRYQAHPVGYWSDEFHKAAEIGLDCIEFILDLNCAEENPLLRPDGPDEILTVATESGVAVRTVCADIFMDAPLHDRDEKIASYGQDILSRLLENGRRLGLTDIVIPCVDNSSMLHRRVQDLFVSRLMPLVEKAEASEINLSLETDLAPEPFAELLGRFGSGKITVNYDTGNSAALGFDPTEELACYGDRISDIHIKDRIRGGGSVVLGAGDTQFDSFVKALQELNYTGPFIMQAYRDDEGVSIFRKQLEWFRGQIRPYCENHSS